MIPLIAMVGVAACSRDAPPPPQAAPVVRDRPLGSTAVMHTNQIDLAKVQLDLAAVRSAIQAYKMTHDGANPPDLASLELKLNFPADLTYQVGTGRVTSQTYPVY